MAFKIYSPGVMDFKRLNDTMVLSPNGLLITEQLYGGAASLSCLVIPQVYYSAVEKSPNLSNLHIDTKLKSFICNEIVNDLESNNCDVMFSIAEDLAQSIMGANKIDEQHLEDITHMQYETLMEKYNQWDNAHPYGTLNYVVNEMIQTVSDKILHPVVDSLVRRYACLPSEIYTEIVGPNILEIKCE